ncbi:hypothetical protein NN561_020363 [Cricetulus griseus]
MGPESPQTPRQRPPQEPNKMATPPSPALLPPLPATEVREPTLARHHRPTENSKVWLGGNEGSPGRAIAASRPHIPFEAMSAHARTGRQATGFQTTAKGRRED